MFDRLFHKVSPARPQARRCVGAAIVAQALALACASAPASADEPLSLDQAMVLAEQRSRQLPGQDAAAAAAREMAHAARRLPDPILKAGINNLPIDGPDRYTLTRDFMTMRSVAVMQEWTRDDKRLARAGRFEREGDIARATRALVLANLQRDTAVAWLERQHQERIHDALVAQRDEAALQVEAADSAYRAGRGSQADAFAARTAVAQIEDRIAEAARQTATAETRLARWIGEAAARPLGAAPAIDAVPLEARDLEGELAHHPQIEVMARQEELAQADAEIARAAKRPDWSVELMFSQRGPAYSNMVSLNVSVPLQWDAANRQDRELAARLSALEQARAEREEATRAHVAEVRAMLQEWQGNRERLARYEHTLLPLATERTRAAVSAYRGGSGTLAAALDARRGEIDTRIERLRLDLETARLWAQLRYLGPVAQNAAGAR